MAVRKKRTAALAAPAPVGQADVERLRQTIQAELDSVTGIEIHTDEDQAAAAECLLTVAALRKKVEAERKKQVTPINKEHARIQALFKPLLDLCDQTRALVSEASGAYALVQAQAQREEMARATKAVQTGDTAELTSALNAVSAAAPLATKGVTFKAFWRAEVVAPDLLPREYLTPDLAKIGAHVKGVPADKEPDPIPGVRYVIETSSTVRPGPAQLRKAK